MAHVLIVDDEKNIRTHLASFVRSLGHDTAVATGGAEALAHLEKQRAEVVFSDVRMVGLDGLALLHEIKRRTPEAIVVLMTAYATVGGAVEAMRAGAYDYLVKPFSLDEVGLLLERVLEVQRLRRDNSALRRAVTGEPLLESTNAAMQHVLATARQAAKSDATMLLAGESGTGKTVLAAAIHSWSARAAGPFVTIGCTTLSEHLLESELFGHVKGAFTGAWKDRPGRLEAGAGGTVFLDEVGELAPELQAKLLRFLEERRFERVGSGETREVDTRIIAATNRELESDLRAGRFREDLYFRLNVVGVRLLPLRERREDIPGLAERVLATLAVRHGRRGIRLGPGVGDILVGYQWPGNVRELVNALERALVLSAGDEILAEHLPDRLLAPPSPVQRGPVGGGGALSLDEMERRAVAEALATSDTLDDAAARLGINVTTLWRKRKRWGLE